MPTFYRASSTVNWNGTAVEGSVEWAKFLLKMPQSRHDVQSYDCHAVPGSAAPGRPPSLLITVSGIVTFGEPSSAPAKTLDTAPRVFSQTFLLLPDVLPESTGDAAAGPKYFVGADSLRFVG